MRARQACRHLRADACLSFRHDGERETDDIDATLSTTQHTIRRGDSLWYLTNKKFEVPLWLLRQYNPDVDLDRVRPGAVVRFPQLRSIQTELG